MIPYISPTLTTYPADAASGTGLNNVARARISNCGHLTTRTTLTDAQ